MDGVTVRAFAEHIGKSHVWVLKLLKQELLPRNADGSIPLEAGLKAYEEYLAVPKKPKGRPSKASKKAKQEPIEKPKTYPQPKIETPPPAPITDSDDEKEKRTAEAVNVNAAMRKAKLMQTLNTAKIKELEFKLKSGELLEKSEVAKEAQWLAEQIKSKLLAIPPRVSSMCEGRIAREIEEIITDAINNALAELQKCKYVNEEK